MKLSDLASRIDCVLTGDGDIDITGIAGLKEAKEGDVTFLSNPKYTKEVKHTKASAIIISHNGPHTDIPCLKTSNPYFAFARAIELFYTPLSLKKSVHPSAVIGETSVIGDNPSIYPNVVIGDNVKIGDNAVIWPNVTIYDHVIIGHNVIIHSNSVIREYTKIGDNVIIQNGAVIGADGFSFARKDDGSHYKIFPLGRVIIEDNVEIQANSAVDRATLGDTIVKNGSKIDNLVQIGHGCSIGENTIICGLTGLAGSTTVGNNVILAGQVGAAGHLTIGNNVIAAAKTGIAGSVKDNKMISGYPGVESSIWRKSAVCFEKLPDLFKRIKKLENYFEKFITKSVDQ